MARCVHTFRRERPQQHDHALFSNLIYPRFRRLNTCISARNYAHFYLLGVSGSLLYLYMTVAATLTVIWADEDDQREAFGSLTASRITWGIFIAVAGWIAVSFVALAGFHTYLLLVGLGTYDWVVMQVRRRFGSAAVLLPALQIRRVILDLR